MHKLPRFLMLLLGLNVITVYAAIRILLSIPPKNPFIITCTILLLYTAGALTLTNLTYVWQRLRQKKGNERSQPSIRKHTYMDESELASVEEKKHYKSVAKWIFGILGLLAVMILIKALNNYTELEKHTNLIQ